MAIMLLPSGSTAVSGADSQRVEFAGEGQQRKQDDQYGEAGLEQAAAQFDEVFEEAQFLVAWN